MEHTTTPNQTEKRNFVSHDQYEFTPACRVLSDRTPNQIYYTFIMLGNLFEQYNNRVNALPTITAYTTKLEKAKKCNSLAEYRQEMIAMIDSIISFIGREYHKVYPEAEDADITEDEDLFWLEHDSIVLMEPFGWDRVQYAVGNEDSFSEILSPEMFSIEIKTTLESAAIELVQNIQARGEMLEEEYYFILAHPKECQPAFAKLANYADLAPFKPVLDYILPKLSIPAPALDCYLELYL